MGQPLGVPETDACHDRRPVLARPSQVVGRPERTHSAVHIRVGLVPPPRPPVNVDVAHKSSL